MPLQDWSKSKLHLDEARARLEALDSKTAKAGYGHACIEKVVEALRQHNHQAEVYVAELVSEFEKGPKQATIDQIVRTAKLAIGAHIDTHRELTSNAIRAEIPPPKALHDDLFGCQMQLATFRPHAANKLWKSLYDEKVRGKGFESCAEMPGIYDPRLSPTTSSSSVPPILEVQLKRNEDVGAATSQAFPVPATGDEGTPESSAFEHLHASIASDRPTTSAHSIDTEDSSEKFLLCMRWQFGTSPKERNQQGSGIHATLNGFGATAVQYWEEKDRAALVAIMPSHLRATRAATSFARANHLSIRTIVLDHCGVNIRQSYIDQTFRLSGEGFYDALSALQIAFNLGHNTDSTSIFCTRSFLATFPKVLHEQFKPKEVSSNGASVSLFLLELQQEQAAEFVDSWHKVRSWLKLNVDRFVAGAVSAGAAMLIPWIISQFKASPPTPPESFAKVTVRIADEPSDKIPCVALGQVLEVKFDNSDTPMLVAIDRSCKAAIPWPAHGDINSLKHVTATMQLLQQKVPQFKLNDLESVGLNQVLRVNLTPVQFVQLNIETCNYKGDVIQATLEDQSILTGHIDATCTSSLNYSDNEKGKRLIEVHVGPTTSQHWCSLNTSQPRVGDLWPRLGRCAEIPPPPPPPPPKCAVNVANQTTADVLVRMPCVRPKKQGDLRIERGGNRQFSLDSPGCAFSCRSATGATSLSCDSTRFLNCNSKYNIVVR